MKRSCYKSLHPLILWLAATASIIAAEPSFTIGGEVKIPKRYHFTNGITAMKAIQNAGGVTDKAAEKKVVVRRDSQEIILDRKGIQKGKRVDLALQAGDVIFVPRKD